MRNRLDAIIRLVPIPKKPKPGGIPLETSGTESADHEAIEKARLIVEAALDLKGERVVALDMRALSAFADTFVIVSGRSDRHVRSIADSIVRALRDQGDPPLGVEGADEGHWVLIDANDAIVHVFEPETREAFDLERLWSDAKSLDLVPPPSPEFED
ncbi:MAG: ribosome silencing factor [bacterium TMED88]|nr:ribosome silencing factor [Deltaproteobacteria bacterium]OUV30705.1 MAG: ribosome silencing factor [bacterium TMED88]